MRALRPQPDALAIRPMTADDADLVTQMMLAHLNETMTDVRPTVRSAEHLVALGIARAAAGDPCFVATRDDELVGFILWVGYALPVDTCGKLCQALGTYVLPSARRQGVASALWAAAVSCAQAAGYARISVATFTPEPLRGLVKLGFQPTGVILWRTLPPSQEADGPGLDAALAVGVRDDWRRQDDGVSALAAGRGAELVHHGRVTPAPGAHRHHADLHMQSCGLCEEYFGAGGGGVVVPGMEGQVADRPAGPTGDTPQHEHKPAHGAGTTTGAAPASIGGKE